MFRIIPLLGLITLLFITSPLFAQGICKMTMKENKLVASCDNQLFTGLEISLGQPLEVLDSTSFFSLFPKMGLVTVFGNTEIEVEYVITNRAGYPQVLFKHLRKMNLGWYTFDNLKFKDNNITFSIDNDPEVPFAKQDLKIIKLAKKLLKRPENWNKNDDRQCEDDEANGQFSFFCALSISSTKVEGSYNHRNAVMQLMRHLIQSRFPGRKWEHRFKDFNNMPETSFEDIQSIISAAEKQIKKELRKG